MVYRVYAEKKREFAHEAAALLSEANKLLGIRSLKDVRILNRYDAENIRPELFEYAKTTVFSEPQVDICTDAPDFEGAKVFAVEFLPGQFDQRADSAAQCIQLISQEDRPLVRSAKVYALYGDVSAEDVEAIKKYVINPVEAREASLDIPQTLVMAYNVPEAVAVLEGFNDLDEAGLAQFIRGNGLAMDLADIKFCQSYFRGEGRCPTITEIKVIDTYWSDHCRHTTFGTIIDSVRFEDELLAKTYEDYLAVRKELGRTKPVCLMDLGTIGARYLKAKGILDKLDESEEINACTVKLDVTVDGKTEPWLLLFKNETHNHPTEIEPFGGAATCIGGAIRDPLSGRSYVYAAMRITGAADPTVPISQTIPGKLPQRKLVTTAAAGYSSYGNQIGLATGIVDELYHPGYAAKHMEIGAVIAAAPAANVRRETPAPGDAVILLGGSTGRDGIGGATGSSKAHDVHSVENCGAEVQKGNAPEERKLQRMFRDPQAARMIKRCNDFGAGGVSVAIGELADGLCVDLNAVPKKYEGLDGTELAISESQERMACVVEAKDVPAFLAIAARENLQAVQVATVTESPRLVLNWNGQSIVDISREFLNSNGAEKHIEVVVPAAAPAERTVEGRDFAEKFMAVATDLNCCSKRGLSERFDSTIGAGTVLMPFGGKNQLTPIQAMVHKISVEEKHTDTCSLMSWGYNPYLTESSPYHGAYLAVAESICKLVASGAEYKDVYLTFQEYFQKLGSDSRKWGQPMAALLGAFRAQKELGAAAIGGKDSMSGSFENIHVPPTLVSFAVTSEKCADIVSPEFKRAGDVVVRIAPEIGPDGLPTAESLLKNFKIVSGLLRSGRACACYTPGFGGDAEAVLKMAIGNGLGFTFADGVAEDSIFGYDYGSFIVEMVTGCAEGCSAGATVPKGAQILGFVTEEPVIRLGAEQVSLDALLSAYEDKLEDIYNCNITQNIGEVRNVSYDVGSWPAPAVKNAKPRILIPVFPGTNCEYDSAKAAADAGLEPQIMVLRNLSADAVSRSVEEFAKAASQSQIIFIPGGFSGGDEPEGSAKFITAFFRNAAVKEQVTKLLEDRDGLMLGICNGFQALVKLGLVPYGKIIDTDADSPTLTFNTIARHQSRIVRTRVASNKSPWLALTKPGEVYSVPISHGEGRFIASPELIAELAANGQIATQYVDLAGNATADVHFNPNASCMAIEGITSPDGRVLGKMGHSERIGSGLYRNVPGEYDIKLFAAAAKYFR